MTKPYLLSAFALLIMAAAQGQNYYPTSVVYLVRDEKGKIIDPTVLDSFSPEKGEELTIRETYFPDSDGKGTHNVKCLESRIEMGGGTLTFSEMTLKYHGKTMRLIFDVSAREQTLRVDSIPFQQGTFRLSDNKAPRDSAALGKWIPAK